MTATNLKGINITGTIVPITKKDEYATHDSQYGLGGWHEVKTIAERDAIPVSRRRRGMAVFVLEDGKCYTLNTSLTNGGWQPYGSYDVVDIVKEALKSGKIEIDLSDYYNKDEINEKLGTYATHTEVKNAENELKALINAKASKIDLDVAIQEVEGDIAILGEKLEQQEVAIKEAKLIAEQVAEQLLDKVDKVEYDAKIAEIEHRIDEDAQYTFVRDAENDRVINVFKDTDKIAVIPAPKEVVLGSACFVANELVTYYKSFSGSLLPETLDGHPFVGNIEDLTVENGPYLVMKNIDNETGELKGGNIICLKNIIPQIDVDEINRQLAEKATQEEFDVLEGDFEQVKAAVEVIKEAIEQEQFVLRSQGASKAGYVMMVNDEGNIEAKEFSVKELPEVKELTAEVTEVKEELTTVQGNITAIEGNVTQISADLTEVKVDLSEVQADIEVAETDITAIKVDVTELKESKLDNSEYTDDINDLDERLNDILEEMN